MLSDEFITECCREFDRDGSADLFVELLRRAFAAGRESAYDRLPWNYAVKDRYGDIHLFGEDLEGALTYAEPIDDYPQLTVLRWRQGLQETAIIPARVPEAGGTDA